MALYITTMMLWKTLCYICRIIVLIMVSNMLLLVEKLARLIIAHIYSVIGDLRGICHCIKFVRFLNVQGLLY